MRNFAVRTIDAGFVAIVTSMSTIVSGVVSILTGMDVFTWSLLVGGLICVAAAIVSGFSDKEKKLPLADEKS
jgi:drug/metabolite transporter (DMT)-like permease